MWADPPSFIWVNLHVGWGFIQKQVQWPLEHALDHDVELGELFLPYLRFMGTAQHWLVKNMLFVGPPNNVWWTYHWQVAKNQSRGLTLRSSAHRHWGDDPPLFRFIFSQPLGVSETCCDPRTMFDPKNHHPTSLGEQLEVPYEPWDRDEFLMIPWGLPWLRNPPSLLPSSQGSGHVLAHGDVDSLQVEHYGTKAVIHIYICYIW